MTKEQILENADNFRYLFDLQSSGRTNMYGAAQYLQDECDLDRQAAKNVLCQWMENYELIAKELGVTV